ncbi:MAG: ABC transporter permease subunit [Candidatus Delongbacteria bacterium]|nr:ABC transporter permease subunit [Candidatus Delongbacteria bacterium]MBN2836970.1 ABC transporter permease subunit [Candidatus Delongbacteria bacterium]
MSKNKIFEILFKTTGRTIILLVLILPVTLIYYSKSYVNSFDFLTILFEDWKPSQEQFGLRAFIFTTLMMGFFSTIIAFLISFSTAVFIYFNEGSFLGKFIYNLIRLMSGIPTVVYGLAGLMLIVPIIRKYTVSPSGLSIFTVIIVLSVLLLPTITIYLLNGFKLVPNSLKTAALSLGSNEVQLFFKVLIPQTKSNILISLAMGFTRAVGDTIIALMVSGNSFRFPISLYQSARNITSQIALLIPGEFTGVEFSSIFFLAVILISIVIIIDLLIIFVDKRK